MSLSPSRIRITMPEFDECLLAAQHGEGWAFDELFRRWNGRMAGFVRAQGADDVDGLVNDIFVKAFRSIGTFSGGEDAFRAWLFRIARNRVIDEYRKRGRTPVATDLDLAESIPGGDVVADAERHLGDAGVTRLLGLLTDEQREVLALRFVADLTIDQIAAATGRRRGAVKQLQRRGLRRLEALLEGERP